MAPGFPELRLIILGDGLERAALESLARQLAIADRVVMPGRVEDPHFYFDETWRAEGEVEEPAIGARRWAKQETHRAVKSVWELCRTAQWCDAADAGRIAAPIACRVMRVHFGDRTAEMHHEHSDTPGSAHIFVLSARYEGFLNALLEAMACGTAVVSFACESGQRKIIRDGVDGLLMPPQDVDALAERIRFLMRYDDERARLGAGAIDVLKRFSADGVMVMWEGAIRGVLAGRAG